MTLDLREATRALIVDPDDHILLVRFEFGGPGDVGNPRHIWATPGGGLETGETTVDGLRRELHEELGLTDVDIGPIIWNRVHVTPMSNGQDGQRDTIHLVRLPRFDPQPAIGWDALRAEHVHEMRWWSVGELHTVPTADEVEPGGIRFAPRRLAELTTSLLADGPPAAPIDVGF